MQLTVHRQWGDPVQCIFSPHSVLGDLLRAAGIPENASLDCYYALYWNNVEWVRVDGVRARDGMWAPLN
jgi:hypothetical protein